MRADSSSSGARPGEGHPSPSLYPRRGPNVSRSPRTWPSCVFENRASVLAILYIFTSAESKARCRTNTGQATGQAIFFYVNERIRLTPPKERLTIFVTLLLRAKSIWLKAGKNAAPLIRQVEWEGPEAFGGPNPRGWLGRFEGTCRVIPEASPCACQFFLAAKANRAQTSGARSIRLGFTRAGPSMSGHYICVEVRARSLRARKSARRASPPP